MTSPVTYSDHEVQVNGLKLHYQEWGEPSSPAVLMLHGFGVSGHMFDEFAARASDSYHLIALDQRGHGDSDWSELGDYSRAAFISDVEGFVKELGLERFVLMGHSMGGLNSAAYTAEYAHRVRRSSWWTSGQRQRRRAWITLCALRAGQMSSISKSS